MIFFINKYLTLLEKRAIITTDQQELLTVK